MFPIYLTIFEEKKYFYMKYCNGPARSRVKREPDTCQTDGHARPHTEKERMLIM